MSFPTVRYDPPPPRKRSLKRKMRKSQSTLAGIDDLIFVCTENSQKERGIVHALYRQQQTLPFPCAWEFPLPDRGVVQFPVVWKEEGLLLLSSQTNRPEDAPHFFCLDAITGKKRWHYPASADVSQTFSSLSAPVVTPYGIVVIAQRRNSEHADMFIFTARGKVSQIIPLRHSPLTHPYNLITDKNAVYVAERTGISKYDLSNGNYLQRFPMKEDCTTANSQLAMDETRLFVGINHNSEGKSLVTGYNKNSGEFLWSRSVGRGITTGLLAWNDTIFLGSKVEKRNEYQILALDASNGLSRWNHPFTLQKESQFYAPLALYQNNILAGSSNGNVYAIDCITGVSENIYQTDKPVYCQPYQIPAEQTIYIIDRNTTIAELELKCHIIVREELRKILMASFVEPELKEVYFRAGLDYNKLAGGEAGTDVKILELIAYMERRGELNDLVELIDQLRPNLQIIDLLGECDEHR